MGIWTTYLSMMTRRRGSILIFVHEKVAGKTGAAATATKELYVMRHRGNDAVAPSDKLFAFFLERKDFWGDRWLNNPGSHSGIELTYPAYKRMYLAQLETPEALAWMEKTAALAKDYEVVLVCYEKDWRYCHRKLLAERIEQQFAVPYFGELHPREKIGCQLIRR